MRILMTGSHGLIGRAIVEYFARSGHFFTRLIREGKDGKKDGTAFWDIEKGSIEREKLEGHDAVIHLAGANIADKRWTPEYKKEILESRVKGTSLFCRTLAELKRPPKVVFCASAVGYYGNRKPHEAADEGTSPGQNFLADVCRQWEDAAEPARRAGLRVVHLRFGMVLSARGGALAKMLPIFRSGLGGKLGSGKQIVSWVVAEEIPSVIAHLVEAEKFAGPVNVVSPQVVTNVQFTGILGKALRRPAVFPVPAFMVGLMFGEMGQALLLEGIAVKPRKLEMSGYRFLYPDLSSALQFVLNQQE